MSIHYDHFKTIRPVGTEVPQQLLEEISDAVWACRRCELAEGRTNAVPGFGNASARIMLVGEAPGRNEDLQGKPFVGAAGKYLTELLGYAGLTREEVFIANVPFLRDQVRTIEPEYLVTMGNFSTKFVLRTERGITGLRGSVHVTGPFKVFPVFHPAAAIYDRSKRDVLEADFRALGRLLGNEPIEPLQGAE